jgi:hypothetical protein
MASSSSLGFTLHVLAKRSDNMISPRAGSGTDTAVLLCLLCNYCWTVITGFADITKPPIKLRKRGGFPRGVNK